MSLLKQRISSPLEAGTSLLDTQHLPSHLTQALEYASKRLARKAVPMTLVMVRRDYQVPWSCATPTSSTASTPNTPEFWTATNSSPSLFAAPVTGIRQLVRRGTNASIASLSSVSTVSSSIASDSGYGSACSTSTSPTFPPPTEPVATPRRWPLTSGSSVPSTPSSVSTATSTAPSVSAACPSPVGVRLLHVHSLTPKEERTLRTTFAKAERKFGTKGLFPPAATAASCGLSGDLIRRSILQNEVLFSSEGLTLLGLDRLYTFKAALAAYARTTLPPSSLASPLVPGESRARIEDAVDELRRLVLANGGRPISKIDLHRSYDWIGVSASALGDVERMYRRAYGGWERAGAFEVPPEEAQKETNNPPVDPEERSRNILRIGTPPAKAPVLKLQTTFDKSLKRPRAIRPEIVQPRSAEFQGQARAKEDDVVELEIKIDGLGRADEGDEDEDLTARPPASGHPYWNNSLGSSIDAMLKRQESPTADGGILRLSVDSQRLGPLTPNGFDDISPITRGEWGFLFSGDGSMSRAKTAPVETC